MISWNFIEKYSMMDADCDYNHTNQIFLYQFLAFLPSVYSKKAILKNRQNSIRNLLETVTPFYAQWISQAQINCKKVLKWGKFDVENQSEICWKLWHLFRHNEFPKLKCSVRRCWTELNSTSKINQKSVGKCDTFLRPMNFPSSNKL